MECESNPLKSNFLSLLNNQSINYSFLSFFPSISLHMFLGVPLCTESRLSWCTTCSFRMDSRYWERKVSIILVSCFLGSHAFYISNSVFDSKQSKKTNHFSQIYRRSLLLFNLYARVTLYSQWIHQSINNS